MAKQKTLTQYDYGMSITTQLMQEDGKTPYNLSGKAVNALVKLPDGIVKRVPCTVTNTAGGYVVLVITVELTIQVGSYMINYEITDSFSSITASNSDNYFVMASNGAAVDYNVNPYDLDLEVSNAEQIEKINNTISFLEKMKLKFVYGVKGDGVTDDTEGIKRAIANESSLYFPQAYYAVQGGEESIFPISKAITLIGEGGTKSGIIVKSGSAQTDVFKVSVNTTISEFSMIGIGILAEASNGYIVPCRHSLLFDIGASGQLINSCIKNCYFNESLDYTIKADNPVSNDGFFLNKFEDNVVLGGIELNRCGDSVSIIRNQLTGSRVGIKASCVTGAFKLFISENNITSKGTAIQLTNVDTARIVGNQIEQKVSIAASETACVTLTNCKGTRIIDNNIDTLGFIDTCVKLVGCYKTKIKENRMGISKGMLPNSCMVNTDATTKYTDIGYDNMYVNDGNTINNGYFIDNGKGTSNIEKNITLLQSWVSDDEANHGSARVTKSSDGIVTFNGIIKLGVTTPYTQIATIPEGFRPGTVTTLFPFSNDNTGYIFTRLLVLPTGEVLIQHSGTTNLTTITLEGLTYKEKNYLLAI